MGGWGGGAGSWALGDYGLGTGLDNFYGLTDLSTIVLL